jgi:hypothetical protein
MKGVILVTVVLIHSGFLASYKIEHFSNLPSCIERAEEVIYDPESIGYNLEDFLIVQCLPAKVEDEDKA